MIASRLDVSESRVRFLELALRTKIGPTFGDRVPREIRPSDVQEWIAMLDRKLAPRSVQKYWQVLAQRCSTSPRSTRTPPDTGR